MIGEIYVYVSIHGSKLNTAKRPCHVNEWELDLARGEKS